MDSHVYSIINCVGSRAAENFRQLHLSFTISFQFEAHKCNIWRCRTNYFLQNQSDFHWHPTFFILQFNCRIYNYNCRFFQNPNCRILQFNCRKKSMLRTQLGRVILGLFQPHIRTNPLYARFFRPTPYTHPIYASQQKKSRLRREIIPYIHPQKLYTFNWVNVIFYNLSQHS